MNSVLILFLCLQCFLVTPASGMAVWMTKEECKKPMRVGEMIMGSEAQSSTVREVQVYRDNTLVTSGGAYIPGEELLVVLVGPDDTGVQFVFEATNAVFIGGGCDGHRVANTKTAKLLLPSDTSPDAPSVQIIAGWATGYTTVHITPTFALTPSRGDPLSGSTPLELHAENSKDTLNAGVEDADAKVTPDSPNAGLRPEMELAGGEGTLPAKTHLRKQPQGLDLPQTLPADHKIKMKPKSPNAFARAHPKLTEKNPKLTVEDGVDNKVDRFTENSAGNKGNIVTRAAAAETALKVPELSAEPAGIAPAVISDTVAPHKEDTRPADEREDTNIENVMESMDKFTEQVQQRAQQKKTTVPKAPLKSPSKRTKFMDSWHSKPRKEKNPVKLEVGDVQRVPSAENDAEQLKQAAELKVAQGEQAQADAELPGADLSATEKRMRRSRGGLPLGKKNEEGEESEKSERREPKGILNPSTRTPGQLVLLVLAVGTALFANAVLLLSVMLCLLGRKDDVWRGVNRILRRKQGQDKE